MACPIANSINTRYISLLICFSSPKTQQHAKQVKNCHANSNGCNNKSKQKTINYVKHGVRPSLKVRQSVPLAWDLVNGGDPGAFRPAWLILSASTASLYSQSSAAMPCYPVRSNRFVGISTFCATLNGIKSLIRFFLCHQ